MSEKEKANATRALAHLLVARDLLKLAHVDRPLACVRAAITTTGAAIHGGRP